MKRPRTLNELVERIAYRTERLQTIIAKYPGDHGVEKVIAFENGVIDNLKGQVRNRTNFYLRCIGC